MPIRSRQEMLALEQEAKERHVWSSPAKLDPRIRMGSLYAEVYKHVYQDVKSTISHKPISPKRESYPQGFLAGYLTTSQLTLQSTSCSTPGVQGNTLQLSVGLGLVTKDLADVSTWDKSTKPSTEICCRMGTGLGHCRRCTHLFWHPAMMSPTEDLPWAFVHGNLPLLKVWSTLVQSGVSNTEYSRYSDSFTWKFTHKISLLFVKLFHRFLMGQWGCSGE